MDTKKEQKIVILVTLLAIFGLVSYVNADYMLTSVANPDSTKNQILTAEAQPKTVPVQKNKKTLNKKIQQQLKKEAKARTPELIDYAGSKVPVQLVNLYKGTDLKHTVQDTTEKLSQMVVAGNISNTQVEEALRGVFSTAATDTGAFTAGLMDKFNLKNAATILLSNPKNSKEIKEAIGEEIKKYAEQEMNKLANQAIGAIFPALQGVQFDFTDMSTKNLKSTLRSAIVNALAQSYLGPQYVAVYLAVSTVCPPCMQKTHAELRRFDKNYIQPVTENIGDEWNRFEDRVKAESERVGKQISAEWKRLNDRVSAELDRQRKQVVAEAERTRQRYQAELKRAQDSRIGKEIERQLNDIENQASRVINSANAELQRELDYVLRESTKLGKKVGAELRREVADAKNTLRSLASNTRMELKKEVKSIANQAQDAKDKIEAEAKRAAEKVQAEAKRAANKVKAEAKRFKKKLGF